VGNATNAAKVLRGQNSKTAPMTSSGMLSAA
jgi:hypothetical protein